MCMYEYRCTWNPEDSVRFLEAGVIKSHEQLRVVAGLRTLLDLLQNRILNCLVISLTIEVYFYHQNHIFLNYGCFINYSDLAKIFGLIKAFGVTILGLQLKVCGGRRENEAPRTYSISFFAT